MYFIGRDDMEFESPEIITHDEWERIAPLSGIDEKKWEEARVHVNDYIGLCRGTLSEAQTPPHIYKKWKRLKDSAQVFRERLVDLLADQDAITAVRQGFDGQGKISSKRLAEVQRHLQGDRKVISTTLDLCDTAIKRVHRTKHGPRTGRESLDKLVRLLNELLKEYVRQRISRSGKKKGRFQSREFVWEVCHRAFNKLTRATVDNAIARVVREELRGIDLDLDLSDELLPSSKKSGKFRIRGNVSKALVVVPIGHVRISVTEDQLSWRVMDRAAGG
jgi:hypothetical protein